MTLLQAMILGLVQAMTEFLPVSSSGHLRLAHAWLGVQSTNDLLFDVLLHVGTLAAVIAVFGRDLVRLGADAWRGVLVAIGRTPPATDVGETTGRLHAALLQSEGLRMVCWIVLASIPTGILGILAGPLMSGDALGVRVVGALLLCNGVLLYSSQYVTPRVLDRGRMAVAGLGWPQALLVGLAQGIAILPGISRSGSTIVTALWAGADRARAGQISFFLAIPAIGGAAVLELRHGLGMPLDAAGGVIWLPYLAGTLISFLVGVLALRLLLRLLQRATFHHFAWYCWALGLAALVVGDAA